MWELDHKESRVLKNWCFWIVVLEKDSWESLGLQDPPPQLSTWWTPSSSSRFRSNRTFSARFTLTTPLSRADPRMDLWFIYGSAPVEPRIQNAKMQSQIPGTAKHLFVKGAWEPTDFSIHRGPGVNLPLHLAAPPEPSISPSSTFNFFV